MSGPWTGAARRRPLTGPGQVALHDRLAVVVRIGVGLRGRPLLDRSLLDRCLRCRRRGRQRAAGRLRRGRDGDDDGRSPPVCQGTESISPVGTAGRGAAGGSGAGAGAASAAVGLRCLVGCVGRIRLALAALGDSLWRTRRRTRGGLDGGFGIGVGVLADGGVFDVAHHRLFPEVVVAAGQLLFGGFGCRFPSGPSGLVSGSGSGSGSSCRVPSRSESSPGNSSTVSAEAPWSLSSAAMSASAAARTRPPPLSRRRERSLRR